MLSIDFKNALNKSADNFTCKLFQLMLKCDPINLKKLGKEYPVEANMVFFYHNACPYNGNDVDFIKLEEMARNMDKG